MDRISKLSQTLTGQPLTTEQRALYERLARACGIKDDDPLWTAMVILGHYERLYRAIPKQIEAAADAKTRSARETLDAHLAREHAAISVSLSAGVERIIADSLPDQVRVKFGMTLAFVIMLVLVLAACCFAGGAWMGRTTADAEAVRRYAWVETADGRTARDLTIAGATVALRTCREKKGRFVVDSAGTATCNVRGVIIGKTALPAP